MSPKLRRIVSCSKAYAQSSPSRASSWRRMISRSSRFRIRWIYSVTRWLTLRKRIQTWNWRLMYIRARSPVSKVKRSTTNSSLRRPKSCFRSTSQRPRHWWKISRTPLVSCSRTSARWSASARSTATERRRLPNLREISRRRASRRPSLRLSWELYRSTTIKWRSSLPIPKLTVTTWHTNYMIWTRLDTKLKRARKMSMSVIRASLKLSIWRMTNLTRTSRKLMRWTRKLWLLPLKTRHWKPKRWV